MASDTGVEEQISIQPMTEADCVKLLALDQGIFPTPIPVTVPMTVAWFKTMPLLGANYVAADGTVVGVSASVALRKESWDKLVAGHLEEGELTEEHLYTGEGPLNVHLYHVEVFDRKRLGRGFIKRALRDTAANARAHFGRDVDKFSAYCVSPASIKVMGELNAERSPRHDGVRSFVVTKPDGAMDLVDVQPGETLDASLKVVSECMMFVLSPP